MRIITTVDGQTTTCVSQVRGSSGALLTTGTVTGVLRKEFGEYDTTALTGIGAIVDPAVSNSPLWNPGVDGVDGYNFIAIIPASAITAPGTYRAEFSIVNSGATYKTIFKIHVGSG